MCKEICSDWKSKARQTFGYFFTQGKWANEVMPTEEINRAIEAIANEGTPIDIVKVLVEGEKDDLCEQCCDGACGCPCHEDKCDHPAGKCEKCGSENTRLDFRFGCTPGLSFSAIECRDCGHRKDHPPHYIKSESIQSDVSDMKPGEKRDIYHDGHKVATITMNVGSVDVRHEHCGHCNGNHKPGSCLPNSRDYYTKAEVDQQTKWLRAKIEKLEFKLERTIDFLWQYTQRHHSCGWHHMLADLLYPDKRK